MTFGRRVIKIVIMMSIMAAASSLFILEDLGPVEVIGVVAMMDGALTHLVMEEDLGVAAALIIIAMEVVVLTTAAQEVVDSLMATTEVATMEAVMAVAEDAEVAEIENYCASFFILSTQIILKLSLKLPELNLTHESI